jgi:HAD superfamily hydrolase (TIGR01509 family)
MQGKIKAAVFDVDGMLLDTREFIFQAYEYTLAFHELHVPERAFIAQQIGKSLQACYEIFAPGSDFEILRETHSDFQKQKMHLIVGYKGLHEMLDELKVQGLKIGAFSSRHTNLEPSLEDAGILRYFGAVVDGNAVKHHKPHPEGLLKVLDELGVAPQNAAMLGDAPVDIAAGKAAGVALTVGITHGFGAEDDLEAAKPDYLVHSLSEIPGILI